MDRSATLNEHTVTAAARYRDNAGRFIKYGWNRIGFSTMWCVTAATARDAAAATILPATEMFGKSANAKTRNGQCHRYHEYDSVPSFCRGAESSTTPTPRCGSSAPA